MVTKYSELSAYVPPFKSIAVTPDGNVYGLDSSGRVWVYLPSYKGWTCLRRSAFEPVRLEPTE